MAIYHLTASTGSKGDPAKADKNSRTSASAGKSAAAKHDYITREGAYTYKGDRVLYTEAGNMPAWAASDPRAYWEAADMHERANGRLFKQVEFAMPLELSTEQQIALARKFVADRTSEIGGGSLPFEWALHEGAEDDGLSQRTKPTSSESSRNPHVHLMISERVNDRIERPPELWFKRAATGKKQPHEGGARKTDALKPEEWLIETRQRWAELCNEALAEAGVDARIDHRTLLEQQAEAEANGDLVLAAIFDRAPQEHLGPAAHGYEQRTGEKSRRREFIETRVAEYAVAVAARVIEKDELVKELAATERELKMLEHSARFIERSIPMEPSPAPVAIATGQSPAAKPAKLFISEIVDAMAAMPSLERIEVAEQIAERARGIQPRAGVPMPVHASLLQILINKLQSIFGLKPKEALDGRPDGKPNFGNGPARLAVERGAVTPAATGGAAGFGIGAGLGAGSFAALGSGTAGGGPNAGAGGNRRAGSSHDEPGYRAQQIASGPPAHIRSRMLDVSARDVVLKWEHNEGALRQDVPDRLEQRRPDSDRALLDAGRGSAPAAAVTLPPAPIAAPAAGAGQQPRAPAAAGRPAAAKASRKRPGSIKKKAPAVGWLAKIAAIFRPDKPVAPVSKTAKKLSSKTKSVGDTKVVRRPAAPASAPRKPRSVAAELRNTPFVETESQRRAGELLELPGIIDRAIAAGDPVQLSKAMHRSVAVDAHFLAERLLSAGAPVRDRTYDLAAGKDEALFRRLVERGGDVALTGEQPDDQSELNRFGAEHKLSVEAREILANWFGKGTSGGGESTFEPPEQDWGTTEESIQPFKW